MTLAERRRAMMAAKSNNSILFEWDYTEGLGSKIVSVDAEAPTMTASGLLLQGTTTAYSACGIAPNISPPSGSYKATVTYSDISSKVADSMVSFFHFSDTAKRVRIGKQGITQTSEYVQKTIATNADGTSTQLPWNLDDTSGIVTLEYDSTAGTITFGQNSNSYTMQISTPQAWSHAPLIVRAQSGTNNQRASVIVQHIKIERL